LKPKLVITLLAIVLIPLCLLLWLGRRVAHNEREMIQHRFQDLLLARLREIDSRITRLLRERERQLLRELAETAGEPARLEELVRSTPLARQTFALDWEGVRYHPPLGDEIGATDQRFLQRTGHLWVNDATLLLGGPPEEQDGTLGIGVPRHRRGNSAPPKGRDHGWHAWHWGPDLNLILWRRDDSGQIAGIDLDPSRLLSEIIGALPDTDPMDETRHDGRIALIESHGSVLYQWGAYEPAEGEAPRAGLPLRHPLSAWKLEYFVPETALGAGLGRSVIFNVLSGVFVVFLALVGLAAYFYRESSRDMREAQQRMTFVNRVSHELRTPLTNIRMYAELLQESLAEGDDKNSRYIGVLVSESERLSRLIANVLTFGRKQDQRLTLRKDPGVVDQVLQAVLAQFAPSLEAKGVAATVSSQAPARVLLDEDVLQQILGNLFSNVEKYAALGESMTVQSEQDGDKTTIKVSDRGPGIPHAHRDRIFEPFYRISDKLTGGVAGTGIGLAIARDLARLHGGDLVLVPTASGACFRLTLQTPRVGEDEGTGS